ncbi:uncharacterized protein TNCV_4183721 [Trichonephila clavipes]|nr:uncharacterized protein TNCV_4183721 [Trichonephila clavipes]
MSLFMMICKTKLRINHLTAVKSVAILEREGNQQYFRVKPKDTDIIEGHSSDLQCHIGNQAGAVQWSKDGFVLDAHQIHLTPSSLIPRSRSGEDLRVTIPDAL